MAQRLEHLGMVYFCEGDNVTAERYFQQAHDLLVKESGMTDVIDITNHPGATRVMGNIATAVVRRGGRKF